MSYKKYVIGFVISVVLTLLAYAAVVERWLEGWVLVGLIIVLALTQFFVQSFLFLHVGDETKPRWNLTSYLYMLMVVGIIVIGSLWIMQNLNYNMMPEHAMDSYMKAESMKGF